MSEEELDTVDISLMNLLCAEGLDGSEDLDVTRCLAILDEWAEIVRKDTTLGFQFTSKTRKYDNSINLFKLSR